MWHLSTHRKNLKNKRELSLAARTYLCETPFTVDDPPAAGSGERTKPADARVGSQKRVPRAAGGDPATDGRDEGQALGARAGLAIAGRVALSRTGGPATHRLARRAWHPGWRREEDLSPLPLRHAPRKTLHPPGRSGHQVLLAAQKSLADPASPS